VTDDLVKLVREKIEAERVRAEDIVSRSRHHESVVNEMFEDIPSNVTNAPIGVHLPHFLLFGGSSLIALEPLSEDQFLHKYGLDVRTIFELTKQKIVIPSLYDRNAEDWERKDHLRGLVEESIVNGVRVDAFMGMDYDEKVKGHEVRFRDMFLDLANAERLLFPNEGRVFPPNTLPCALAHRITRLQILDADAARDALEYFESGDLVAFLWVVEVAKRRTAHITAGGGKKYVWGPLDLALFREHRVPRTIPSLPDLRLLYDGSFLTEAMEYVLGEVLEKTKPFDLLEWYVDGKKLLEFVTRPDNVIARDHLWQILDDLPLLALENGNIDPLVDDYKRLVADYRKRLRELEIVAGAAARAATGAVVGFLLPGALGGALGSLLGSLLAASTTKEGSPALNTIVRRLYNRRAYRVLACLDYVTGGQR